jgi:hypothetical protein
LRNALQQNYRYASLPETCSESHLDFYVFDIIRFSESLYLTNFQSKPVQLMVRSSFLAFMTKIIFFLLLKKHLEIKIQCLISKWF